MPEHEITEGCGIVAAVCVSAVRGMKKTPVAGVRAVADFGLDGDAHAGDSVRQVSLLGMESIEKMRAKGCDVAPGDFAENITTKGIDLCALKIGARVRVGTAILEISQIGKVCHDRCAIYYQAGDCVMPREGVFARVIEGGEIKNGDKIYAVL